MLDPKVTVLPSTSDSETELEPDSADSDRRGIGAAEDRPTKVRVQSSLPLGTSAFVREGQTTPMEWAKAPPPAEVVRVSGGTLEGFSGRRV